MNIEALNRINSRKVLTDEEIQEILDAPILDDIAEYIADATEYVAESLEDLAAWLRS